MDALNKAEQAKRQGQASETVPGSTAPLAQPAQSAQSSQAVPAAQPAQSPKSTQPSLTLELTPLSIASEPPAAPEANQAPPALPKLPDLGVLDEEFIAHAATAKSDVKAEKPPTRPAPEEPSPALPAPAAASVPKTSAIPQKAVAPDRKAAQNLFAAKQPVPPGPNKRFFLVIGLLAVVAAGAIGVYFWLQLQPSSGMNMLKPTANTPRLPTQPVPSPPPASAPVIAAPEAPPLPANEPVRLAATPVRNEPPKTFNVTTSKLTLNPSLANGYEAYIAGNYSAAKNEYLQVLQNEPSNLDALHGMAAISLRQGRPAAAEEYYLKAIEADPKDALAQSGLIGLKSQIDPQLAETRLNALLAAQPELPFLHFALGNLYASQNRWNEAQAAFFKAYRGEPDNPDTLFNLAVSLDQLHQSKLALQYYKQAQAAAVNRPASFDKVQLSARLSELQP